MKKLIFLNVTALFCAAALFSGSAVYAASQMDKLESVAEAELGYDDNFQQDSEPGIAEIFGGNSSETSSRVSSAPSSSEAPSEASSQPSSDPGSSTPVSSKETPVSAPSSKEESSKPAPSSEPPSSEPPPSSAPPSSEPLPSEPESETVIELEMPSDTETPEESSAPVTPPDVNVDDPALLDMVAGAVQREIIGVNTPPSPKYYEAYKAQAVACHSYMEYHRRLSGSYPSMSYCTPQPETLNLVAQVLNELMYYNGSVINASYHASSGGHTQSASYVWGNDVPYLRGVESAYDDAPANCTVTAGDFASRLSAAGVGTDGDPSGWISLDTATWTDGNFVNTIEICGRTVTGRFLRESVLGASTLKSAKITDISFDGNSFRFSTLGYGHGVGLSQLGALGYAANEGWGYRDILTHYYTGVTIQ